MGNWADAPENIPSQPEGSHGTSRMVHRNLSSQMSSVSRGTTCWDRNFMNNINANMQNVLSPLMLMLQQSQDRAEERDRMQRSQDDERKILIPEQEEERCLQETQIQAEEQRRNDQLNMYMMAMLSKMTGVPLDKPPSGLHLDEYHGWKVRYASLI
ncbi:hypothetical protein O181_086168 [Austropuccinia psidii MF-1]|uniref:Uncharacterized protein n=1 Tax=Austropuccinia psidii MF-1 TaxID=1389203 RepID=A0A9Q3FUI6_9BASI|nr:hypothetical protein [Austropuccinia psidii MF-1]